LKEDLSCRHGKTHEEKVFVDLEDDGTMSYDIYEVCDNPDCNESWVIGDISDHGEVLAQQMGLGLFQNGR
jgi:hypothetical protein